MPVTATHAHIHTRTRVHAAHVCDEWQRIQTAGEFVLVNELLACVLAMVAEDRGMNAVLGELLSATGANVYVKDMRRCVRGV